MSPRFFKEQENSRNKDMHLKINRLTDLQAEHFRGPVLWFWLALLKHSEQPSTPPLSFTPTYCGSWAIFSSGHNQGELGEGPCSCFLPCLSVFPNVSMFRIFSYHYDDTTLYSLSPRLMASKSPCPPTPGQSLINQPINPGVGTKK